MDTCKKHLEGHWKERGYRNHISIGTEYFVKFGNPKSLLPELATLEYIFEHARSHPDIPCTPRIPQVKHHFENQITMYMVMEYIPLANSPPDLAERTIEALRWLSSVPAPPGHVFGPLGGGLIRHRFFLDSTAPLAFSSIEALERYIARVRPCLYFLEHQLMANLYQAMTRFRPPSVEPKLEPVILSGERLMFMQADMDSGNFGVDEHGNTVLMDFGDIAVLPESFAAYTLSSKDRTGVMATALGLSSSNVFSLAVASSLLWMTADPTLRMLPYKYLRGNFN